MSSLTLRQWMHLWAEDSRSDKPWREIVPEKPKWPQPVEISSGTGRCAVVLVEVEECVRVKDPITGVGVWIPNGEGVLVDARVFEAKG